MYQPAERRRSDFVWFFLDEFLQYEEQKAHMLLQCIVLQLSVFDLLIGEIHVRVLHSPTGKQNPLKGQGNSPFPNVALSET